MASRLTLISPKIDESLVRFVDALLCKPGLDLKDLEAIGRLVRSGFKSDDSPMQIAQGDPCINLAVMHRLSGLKTGMSVYHNSLTLFLSLIETDPERAKVIALTHPHGASQREFIGMWQMVTKQVIMDTDIEAVEIAWKTGNILMKLYPAKTYKAMEKMLQERLGQKEAKVKAGEIAKEANATATATATESAKTIVNK